jgi:hypothetical protein
MTQAPQSKIGSKHFSGLAAENFSSPFLIVIVLLDHAPDKQRRRSRVQSELVANFDFFAHAENKRAF